MTKTPVELQVVPDEYRSKVTFEQVSEGMDKLGQHRRPAVTELWAQAMSYVWGWQDAGGVQISSSAAYDFGLAFALHCIEWERGTQGTRRTIQEAWKNWVERGSIG